MLEAVSSWQVVGSMAVVASLPVVAIQVMGSVDSYLGELGASEQFDAYCIGVVWGVAYLASALLGLWMQNYVRTRREAGLLGEKLACLDIYRIYSSFILFPVFFWLLLFGYSFFVSVL